MAKDVLIEPDCGFPAYVARPIQMSMVAHRYNIDPHDFREKVAHLPGFPAPVRHNGRDDIYDLDQIEAFERKEVRDHFGEVREWVFRQNL